MPDTKYSTAALRADDMKRAKVPGHQGLVAGKLLFAGPLEPTNQRHAVVQIAGIELCQAYRRQ